jgi:hypothetical protein
MTRRIVHGVFVREADLLRAAEAAREQGWRILDIYTPYPIHDTGRLLGLRRSRLPRAAFVFGLLGVALALWFQFWVSAFDWPINIGGRPWNSLPAFVPVTFEMMVLFAGFGVVLTWLLVCRLFPGKTVVVPVRGVTDDRFVVEVQEPLRGEWGAGMKEPASFEAMRRLFQECHADAVFASEMG